MCILPKRVRRLVYRYVYIAQEDLYITVYIASTMYIHIESLFARQIEVELYADTVLLLFNCVTVRIALYINCKVSGFMCALDIY